MNARHLLISDFLEIRDSWTGRTGRIACASFPYVEMNADAFERITAPIGTLRLRIKAGGGVDL